MITIKLESTEEFDKLNLPHDSTILTQLSTRYPEEFEKTINYMKEMMEDVYERRYDNILDVCSMAEIIEELDFMIAPEKEILTNYYVEDEVMTEKGTYKMITANGYQLKWGGRIKWL